MGKGAWYNLTVAETLPLETVKFGYAPLPKIQKGLTARNFGKTLLSAQ